MKNVLILEYQQMPRETAPKTLEKIAKFGPDTLNTLSRMGRAAVATLRDPHKVRELARAEFSGAHARTSHNAPNQVTPAELGANVRHRSSQHDLSSGFNPYIRTTPHEVDFTRRKGLIPRDGKVPADPNYLFTHQRFPEGNAEVAHQMAQEVQRVTERDRIVRARTMGADTKEDAQ